jgi:hypothetical protein
MAEAKKRIPELAEFSEPLIATSESLNITKALDQRLELLCSEFGITSGDKYRTLCLKLLAEVIGIPGFQIVDKPPKRGGGAPVVWTLRRHASLVDFVKKCISEKETLQRAIDRARKQFAEELSDPDLKDATVRAEYFRAKRFFESAPRVSALMLLTEGKAGQGLPGSAFADFIKDGATVFTRHGKQEIAPTHLVRPKGRSHSARRAASKASAGGS